MKAWRIHDDFSGYSTVVFAETREKARALTLRTDLGEDLRYIDVHPYRFPEADQLYEVGNFEIDWYNPSHRKFLTQFGWSCEEPDFYECSCCVAKDTCDKYDEEAIKEWEDYTINSKKEKREIE